MSEKTRKSMKHLLKNAVPSRRKVRSDLRRVVFEINHGKSK